MVVCVLFSVAETKQYCSCAGLVLFSVAEAEQFCSCASLCFILCCRD